MSLKTFVNNQSVAHINILNYVLIHVAHPYTNFLPTLLTIGHLICANNHTDWAHANVYKLHVVGIHINIKLYQSMPHINHMFQATVLLQFYQSNLDVLCTTTVYYLCTHADAVARMSATLQDRTGPTPPTPHFHKETAEVDRNLVTTIPMDCKSSATTEVVLPSATAPATKEVTPSITAPAHLPESTEVVMSNTFQITLEPYRLPERPPLIVS